MFTRGLDEKEDEAAGDSRLALVCAFSISKRETLPTNAELVSHTHIPLAPSVGIFP